MAHTPFTIQPAPVRVRRALISVSDKEGIVPLARALVEMGVMIISTGGTAKALDDAGVRCTPIEDITGLPEMLDGRVKTLHPAVHGGLLAVRDHPEHADALRRHRIEPIDLVVINLYPFQATVARPGVTRAEAIENIDIGGPSMIRSAAKNHAYVAVVTSPAQYGPLLDELRATGACTSPALRARLATDAFAMTAAYDAAITTYLSAPPATDATHPPAHLHLAYELAQTLRYGENPHQHAAVYRTRTPEGPSVIPGPLPHGAQQLHGKELSYNNIADASGALDCVRALIEHPSPASTVAAAIIKHANPCGAALAPSAQHAIDRAIAGDPVAAFGGILACSAVIDAPAAERLAGKDTFLEVVLAPGFTTEALEILKAKSANVRLLRIGDLAGAPVAPVMYRSVPGGLLVQQRDTMPARPEHWVHAAGPRASPGQVRAAVAIEAMVRCLSSNAVALGAIEPAGGGACVRLIGAGMGQVDRVTACKLAVEKARQFSPALLTSAIAVSDAFFPFADGPTILLDAGVKVLVHTGGSKRDQETFDLCNARGITCLVTGVRRFKH
jgi:phosphoribosylaminoimidazolecarboxamide formyltransferase/IMP cyclohydrolase